MNDDSSPAPIPSLWLDLVHDIEHAMIQYLDIPKANQDTLQFHIDRASVGKAPCFLTTASPHEKSTIPASLVTPAPPGGQLATEHVFGPSFGPLLWADQTKHAASLKETKNEYSLGYDDTNDSNSSDDDDNDDDDSDDIIENDRFRANRAIKYSTVKNTQRKRKISIKNTPSKQAKIQITSSQTLLTEMIGILLTEHVLTVTSEEFREICEAIEIQFRQSENDQLIQQLIYHYDKDNKCYVCYEIKYNQNEATLNSDKYQSFQSYQQHQSLYHNHQQHVVNNTSLQSLKEENAKKFYTVFLLHLPISTFQYIPWGESTPLKYPSMVSSYLPIVDLCVTDDVSQTNTVPWIHKRVVQPKMVNMNGNASSLMQNSKDQKRTEKKHEDRQNVTGRNSTPRARSSYRVDGNNDDDYDDDDNSDIEELSKRKQKMMMQHLKQCQTPMTAAVPLGRKKPSINKASEHNDDDSDDSDCFDGDHDDDYDDDDDHSDDLSDDSGNTPRAQTAQTTQSNNNILRHLATPRTPWLIGARTEEYHALYSKTETPTTRQKRQNLNPDKNWERDKLINMLQITRAPRTKQEQDNDSKNSNETILKRKNIANVDNCTKTPSTLSFKPTITTSTNNTIEENAIFNTTGVNMQAKKVSPKRPNGASLNEVNGDVQSDQKVNREMKVITRAELLFGREYSAFCALPWVILAPARDSSHSSKHSAANTIAGYDNVSNIDVPSGPNIVVKLQQCTNAEQVWKSQSLVVHIFSQAMSWSEHHNNGDNNNTTTRPITSIGPKSYQSSIQMLSWPQSTPSLQLQSTVLLAQLCTSTAVWVLQNDDMLEETVGAPCQEAQMGIPWRFFAFIQPKKLRLMGSGNLPRVKIDRRYQQSRRYGANDDQVLSQQLEQVDPCASKMALVTTNVEDWDITQDDDHWMITPSLLPVILDLNPYHAMLSMAALHCRPDETFMMLEKLLSTEKS